MLVIFFVSIKLNLKLFDSTESDNWIYFRMGSSLVASLSSKIQGFSGLVKMILFNLVPIMS